MHGLSALVPFVQAKPSAKVLILGIDCWIRAARNVYIQETVNFMRAFERGHAC
jgi:hypothetical protein